MPFGLRCLEANATFSLLAIFAALDERSALISATREQENEGKITVLLIIHRMIDVKALDKKPYITSDSIFFGCFPVRVCFPLRL